MSILITSHSYTANKRRITHLQPVHPTLSGHADEAAVCSICTCRTAQWSATAHVFPCAMIPVLLCVACSSFYHATPVPTWCWDCGQTIATREDLIRDVVRLGGESR